MSADVLNPVPSMRTMVQIGKLPSSTLAAQDMYAQFTLNGSLGGNTVSSTELLHTVIFRHSVGTVYFLLLIGTNDDITSNVSSTCAHIVLVAGRQDCQP